MTEAEAAAAVAALKPETRSEEQEDDPTVIEILSELEPVVRLALACANRLFVLGTGVGGFDLAQVEVMARWMSIEITPQRLEDLRALEAEVVAIFHERSAP